MSPARRHFAWRGVHLATAHGRRFRPARRCGRLAGMRLAIFDFDGTLADTRHNIVLTMREAMVEFFAAAFHA